MPTLSPLATLAATLATVCQQARQHQQLLSKNEAATRAVLIDPVLRALGWDTANVAMVEPERTVETKQSLDYVLKSHSGSIMAVIEAKKLGEPLDKLGHVGALIGYVFSLKPTALFITDGLTWHCYSPGHSHYEPTNVFKLSEYTLLPVALQLITLLDAAHGGYGLAQPETNLPFPTGNLAQKQKLPKIPSVIFEKNLAPLTPATAKNWLPLKVELAIPGSPSGKPSWLRLPDGSVQSLKTWKDILTQVAE